MSDVAIFTESGVAPVFWQDRVRTTEDVGGSALPWGETPQLLEGEAYGYAAVSGDTFVYAAFREDAVHIYDREPESAFTFTTTLSMPATFKVYGIALAGEWLAVLTNNYYPADELTINLYVYENVAGTWTLRHTFPTVGVNDLSPNGLAISPDGTWIIYCQWIHAEQPDSSYAYCFKRTGGTWAATQTISSLPDVFGYDISISSAGVALFGYPYAATGGYYRSGRVDVYTESSGTWSFDETLTDAAPADNSWFGATVSISADGLTAAIGSDDAAFSMWEDSGSGFALAEKVVIELGYADGEDHGDWGRTYVALSHGGSVLAVGAELLELVNPVYVHSFEDSALSLTQELEYVDPTIDVPGIEWQEVRRVVISSKENDNVIIFGSARGFPG